MSKTILITGSTDGIGIETAKILIDDGHRVLLHGRNPDKLERIMDVLSVDGFIADLSDLNDVRLMAVNILQKYQWIDVLINNAGVLKTPHSLTKDGFDIRFMVNTIAPFYLTQKIMPLFGVSGRVINLSSAAQSTVNIDALLGKITNLGTMEAYSQSKLALTMWSMQMAKDVGDDGLIIIPVNPASLIGSKMVKEGFGVEGKDLSVGATILSRLATEDEFSDKSGQYFDNDKGHFADPHPDALDEEKRNEVVRAIKDIISGLSI